MFFIAIKLSIMIECMSYADVAELADAQDLGSCGATRAGSIPVIRIENNHKVR